MTHPASFITPVITVVATVLLLRLAWTNVPKWVKKQQQDGGGGGEEDLANPEVIWKKMYQLFELVSKLCEDVTEDDISWYKMHLCFFAYLHLQHELNIVDPNHRHEANLKEGEEVETEEVQDYAELLDVADWAYEASSVEVEEKLQTIGYRLIRHETATSEPGRVGHYMAVHHEQRIVLISIKGTDTISDVLTDVIGHSVERDLDRPFVPCASTHIRCHEGIWAAAQVFADDIQHLLETFFLPQGYRILLCGHSLGGAVACLVGVILKSRLADSIATIMKKHDESWLRVVTFASPACLDVESAQACMPFITSIVNNTDCIPRFSIINVITMNKLLLQIETKLNDRGLHGNNIGSAMKLMNELTKADNGELLMTQQEIDDVCNQVRESQSLQEYHLIVPGRVVYLWRTAAANKNACDDDDNTDGNEDKKSDTDETTEEAPTTEVVYARSHHGEMGALSHIEVDRTMMVDHTTSSYKDSLLQLLEQRKEHE